VNAVWKAGGELSLLYGKLVNKVGTNRIWIGLQVSKGSRNEVKDRYLSAVGSN
jgi:hypothetical protein